MLDFLNTFIMRKGISPSYAEMQDALGYRSKASIARYLYALRERGLIWRRAASSTTRWPSATPTARITARSGTTRS
jgi:SOS-response transcriptional repressor LexA